MTQYQIEWHPKKGKAVMVTVSSPNALMQCIRYLIGNDRMDITFIGPRKRNVRIESYTDFVIVSNDIWAMAQDYDVP